jgi:hypothetical protein
MKKTIEDSFNLAPLETPNYEIETLQGDIQNDSAIKDFEQSRANIKNIISIGTNAIGEIADLAHASQDPSHYEVLTNMIKNLSDVSDKLLKTHESLEKIINKKNSKKLGAADSGINLFVSTAEISAAIKALDKK